MDPGKNAHHALHGIRPCRARMPKAGRIPGEISGSTPGA
jgi:hypothetical protein